MQHAPAEKKENKNGFSWLSPSTFRNFGFAEVTQSRKSSNKFGFPLNFS